MTINRKQLRKAIRDQGWTVEETKKGFFAVSPDGHKILWHMTPSDHRSDKNTMALMTAAGFEWPYDAKAHRAKKKREGK